MSPLLEDHSHCCLAWYTCAATYSRGWWRVESWRCSAWNTLHCTRWVWIFILGLWGRFWNIFYLPRYWGNFPFMMLHASDISHQNMGPQIFPIRHVVVITSPCFEGCVWFSPLPCGDHIDLSIVGTGILAFWGEISNMPFWPSISQIYTLWPMVPLNFHSDQNKSFLPFLGQLQPSSSIQKWPCLMKGESENFPVPNSPHTYPRWGNGPGSISSSPN